MSNLLKTVEPKPQQYLDQGKRASQMGRYMEAVHNFKKCCEVWPEKSEPYHLLGNTCATLGAYDDALASYKIALNNLGEEDKTQRPWLFYILYYNRGNAFAVTDKHNKAIKAFTKALGYESSPKGDILYNRGNSFFAERKFADACKDFEDAFSKGGGSSASLAQGNSLVQLGKFKEAYDAYERGIDKEEMKPHIGCLRNQGRVNEIQEILGDSVPDSKIKRDDFFLSFEAPSDYFPRSGNKKRKLFVFNGNQGNIGNIPYEDGYEGMDGFALEIVVPKKN